jgi:cephalosporin hydroxylase
MTLKEAAVELLKVADQIDKEASEVTKFVCEACNHTSTLANINAKRAEVAKTAGENVTVADVTVNDKIHCPACDGVMAYSQTADSEKFYFDPEKKVAEEKVEEKVEEKKEEPKKEEKEEVEASKKASIDYDSLQRYSK